MPKTTWTIYEIRHQRSPGAPIIARYQFTDGQGKRRHFATKARAKLQAAKDKALYHQEGRLAAGLTGLALCFIAVSAGVQLGPDAALRSVSRKLTRFRASILDPGTLWSAFEILARAD
jgi:hypothetical protein